MHVTYDVNWTWDDSCPNGGYKVTAIPNDGREDDLTLIHICTRKSVDRAREIARGHFEQWKKYTSALWNDGEHNHTEHWEKE